MKKICLVIFMFIAMSIITSAQQNYQDVVYLKNGNIIRGVIIEQEFNKSVKIETVDKSVFVFQIDEIEKMTKEVSQTEQNNPDVSNNNNIATNEVNGASNVAILNTDGYCIINISRKYTKQEWNTRSDQMDLMIYINEKPVCKISSRTRVSIKLFSIGRMSLSVKYIPNATYTEKMINDYYHPGPAFLMEATHGGKYFLNIDNQSLSGGFTINSNTSLVSTPESEGIFGDEKHFKKNPEIKLYTEDAKNPFTFLP